MTTRTEHIRDDLLCCADIFKPGDRVVTNYGGHYAVKSVHRDEGGYEFDTLETGPDRNDLKVSAGRICPWVIQHHGPWQGTE